ncbi:hypothetical protein [Peptoniphilus vaginalis]|uniref:hypothetical protein n=1 Tax=Peptoniphilus vaginalis TaxID=1756987 RepID=UPI0023F76E51|nr:hypothetical protein [Peptoniphilus vaginalis]
MNKKLTSLSLAGVMLLSTASPVFAEAKEAMTKEPTKMEQLVKKGEKKLEEVKKDGKEVKEKAKEKMTEAKEKVEEKAKKVEEKAEEKAKEVKTVDVKATTQKVKLDGKDVVIYGYNIDGYNYFKLRDLAAVLKDSKAKFGVEYKDALVTLTKGADYKVAESDQKEVKAMSKGMLTNDKVMVGDKALTATAYKVDNSNYYKLRDLGKELGFGVGYDEATKSVLLTSGKEVKEEKVAPKLEELKEAVKKELVNEKEVRESEAYKKADDKVKSNFENAIAAAKSLLADEKATAEQFTNELKALVEAKEKLGFKADAKVEEKKDAKAEEKKDAKTEEKKETKENKEVKEEKKDDKKEVKEAK